MPCARCSAIFSGERPPLWTDITADDPFRGFETYSEVRAFEAACFRPLHSEILEMCHGALGGCQICDITWRHFFKDKTPEKFISTPFFIRGSQVHTFSGSGTHYRLKNYELPGTVVSEGTLEIEIALNSPMDRHIAEYKSIILAPIEDDVHHSILSRPDPGLDIYSPSTWSTIQKWLSTCKQDHAQCNRESGHTWYPTRLLKIQNTYDIESAEERVLWLAQLATGAKYPIDIRLVETAIEPPKGRYISLTHRWNDSIVLTTKTTNIAQMKQRFPAHWPSPTFLDAITLAFKLGVEYIWIDSLCIIQDDPADWEVEALTMGKVYSNSLMTISATTAEKGLHFPRNPVLIKPCVVLPKWKGLDSKPLTVMDSQFWGDRIQRSPVGTRGWIIQERWLSARVLHFAFDQLVWECREETMSETFPLGLPKEISGYGRRSFKHANTTLPISAGAITKESLLRRDWNSVVDTYGRAELTQEEDKLVAIAGVAEKFALKMDDEWMAGLWKKGLPGDLLWSVDKTRRTNKPQPVETAGGGHRQRAGTVWSTRLEQYQAPSWSWASVNGDIICGAFVSSDSPEAMINLVDISITPLNPRFPLGRITSARLTLNGTLYPLRMHPLDWRSQYDTAMRNRQVTPLPPKIHIAGLPMKKIVSALGREQEKPSYVVAVLPDQLEEYEDIGSSCFLPVRMWVYHNPGEQYHGQHMVTGICLISTWGRRQGEYKRLGHMTFSKEDTKLFEDGEIFRREGEKSGCQPHPTSLIPSLYEEGKPGVFSIV